MVFSSIGGLFKYVFRRSDHSEKTTAEDSSESTSEIRNVAGQRRVLSSESTRSVRPSGSNVTEGRVRNILRKPFKSAPHNKVISRSQSSLGIAKSTASQPQTPGSPSPALSAPNAPLVASSSGQNVPIPSVLSRASPLETVERRLENLEEGTTQSARQSSDVAVSGSEFLIPRRPQNYLAPHNTATLTIESETLTAVRVESVLDESRPRTGDFGVSANSQTTALSDMLANSKPYSLSFADAISSGAHIEPARSAGASSSREEGSLPPRQHESYPDRFDSSTWQLVNASSFNISEMNVQTDDTAPPETVVMHQLSGNDPVDPSSPGPSQSICSLATPPSLHELEGERGVCDYNQGPPPTEYNKEAVPSHEADYDGIPSASLQLINYGQQRPVAQDETGLPVSANSRNIIYPQTMDSDKSLSPGPPGLPRRRICPLHMDSELRTTSERHNEILYDSFERGISESQIAQPPSRRSRSLGFSPLHFPRVPTPRMQSEGHYSQPFSATVSAPARRVLPWSYGPSPLPIGNDSCWTVLQEVRIPIQLIVDRGWQVGGTLGSGASGKVYLALKASLGECAIKRIKLSRSMSKGRSLALINELKVFDRLSTLNRNNQLAPYILKPTTDEDVGDRCYWISRSSRHLHIASQLCPGGTLFDYLPIVDDAQLLIAVAQLATGLYWLHRHEIVHHDFKPHNVLVDHNGNCVIADFGGSKLFNRLGQFISCAEASATMTLPYAAPELLAPVDGHILYDHTIDWWSFGVSVFEMRTKRTLFESDDLRSEIRRGPPVDLKTRMLEAGCSISLIHFVKQLLDMNPRQRLQGQAVLNHRYIRPIQDDIEREDERYIAIPNVARVAVKINFPPDYSSSQYREEPDSLSFSQRLENNKIAISYSDQFYADHLED